MKGTIVIKIKNQEDLFKFQELVNSIKEKIGSDIEDISAIPNYGNNEV